MKAVIQTVTKANVLIDGETNNSIGKGFLIYVGFTNTDTEENIDKMVYKISGLRVFSDENDKMNLSLKDIDGELLVISNFTLYANLSHGFRPSFVEALEPTKSTILYDNFVEKLKAGFPSKVKTGKFGSHMEVTSLNDGPRTFVYEV